MTIIIDILGDEDEYDDKSDKTTRQLELPFYELDTLIPQPALVDDIQQKAIEGFADLFLNSRIKKKVTTAPPARVYSHEESIAKKISK